MILVIDNYDSFTFNLVQYLQSLGQHVEVARNDAITVHRAKKMNPDHILISPGPCTPDEAGVSCAVISALGPKIPLLGVCLGHQCIASVYGGDIVRAGRIVHGKTSLIEHDGQGIHDGIDNPFDATRYHSLLVDPSTLPDCLAVNAWTAEGEIMGLVHTSYPVWGVQYHPESILTGSGMKILENFLKIYPAVNRRRKICVE